MTLGMPVIDDPLKSELFEKKKGNEVGDVGKAISKTSDAIINTKGVVYQALHFEESF